MAFPSRYDVLTTLLNRRSFMEDMEQHIAECKKFGLIMYDLDNFKQINDTYGHNEGDVVLSELAGRSKELADEKMQVYRLAGDEFIAIVEDGRPEIVENYAKAIQETFRKPYLVSGEEQYLHSSMGMALYPRDGHNSTELISSVDKAMYTVKNSGKNGMAFYQEGM
ncbi:MAG: GGDEF domain-containing protein [Roseburia sp.]|nr:GGDEF domain-containing protein [Roseburia sp.]